jgi:hypothetical protein
MSAKRRLNKAIALNGTKSILCQNFVTKLRELLPDYDIAHGQKSWSINPNRHQYLNSSYFSFRFLDDCLNLVVRSRTKLGWRIYPYCDPNSFDPQIIAEHIKQAITDISDNDEIPEGFTIVANVRPISPHNF